VARSIVGARLAKVGVSFVEYERMLNICRHMQIIYDIISLKVTSFIVLSRLHLTGPVWFPFSKFIRSSQLMSQPFRFFLQGLLSGSLHSFLWLNLLSC
jgi:hypothetical protein